MDDDELLMLYDGPTSVLEGRDLASIAKYIQSPQCKQVFVIVRAIYCRADFPLTDRPERSLDRVSNRHHVSH